MQTVSENACFGGTQGVYTHASTACSCDMTFGLFLPEEAKDGPVPVLWYLLCSPIPRRAVKVWRMMRITIWAKARASM